MRKITTLFRFILTLAACAFVGNAMADDDTGSEITSITVNGSQVEVAGIVDVTHELLTGQTYQEETEAFSTEDICSYLGITDISSATQYSVNVSDYAAVEDPYGDGAADGWHSPSGDLSNWGVTGGVCVKIQNASDGLIDYIGTFDESWEGGDEFVALWAFVANDKAAILRITITFIDPPTVAFDNLNIVNETPIAAATSLYYMQTRTVECSVEISSDVLSSLGLSASEFASLASSGDMVLAAYNDEYGCKVDSLESITATDGWVKCTCERNTDGTAGDMTNECCLTTWSNNEHYYIHDMAFDAETNTLSFTVGAGQLVDAEGQALAVDSTIYTDIYFVNSAAGDDGKYNALKMRHTVTIIEQPVLVISELTQVGETQTITVDETINSSSYKTFTFPIDAAATALGCDVSDIEVLGMKDAENLSYETTANNGGWWFDADGFIGQWGSTVFYIEPSEYYDYSEMRLGQYGNSEEDSTYTASIYCTYNGQYYLVNITLTTHPRVEIYASDLNIKTTFSGTVTQALDASYSWSDETLAIPLTSLQSYLGTTSPTLYGELSSSQDLTDESTNDPAPGFWLTTDGYVAVWGNDTYWGISTAVVTDADYLYFNCIQMPGMTNDGDSYTGTFYLVNDDSSDDDGKKDAVKVTLTYVIGEVIQYNDVGSASITVSLSTDDFDKDIPFWDDMLEALGVDADELMQNNTLRSASGYTATTTPDIGIFYDATGTCVNPYTTVYVFFVYFDEGVILTASDTDVLKEGETFTSQFYFISGINRYTVNITFMTPDDYKVYMTPVEGIAADAAASGQAGAIYDLSGRKVSKAVKGVYIQDGKKYIVK